jgi:hypothetical protein
LKRKFNPAPAGSFAKITHWVIFLRSGLCSVEGFFELHSRATEEKKEEKRVQKDNFLAN